MSRQYDEYLEEHNKNVKKAYDWFVVNMPKIFESLGDGVNLEHQIAFAHDFSKGSFEEYAAYDNYFYGGNRSYKVVKDFNYAWLHHIHNNPHHWQYWVLINDDSTIRIEALEMPLHFVIEMICDWWSFSWKSGNLHDIFDWYAKRNDYMCLHPKTRKNIEGIFDLMLDRLGGRK